MNGMSSKGRYSKVAKGKFIPKNPQKYLGDVNNIIFRSSWENFCFGLLDMHDSVIGWISEGISIPYRNPLNGGKISMYVPDLLIIYLDKNGKKHVDLLEIKPAKETPMYVKKPGERLSKQTQLAQVINAAKFQAAQAYCKKNGITFRVATEDQLFSGRGKKKK